MIFDAIVNGSAAQNVTLSSVVCIEFMAQYRDNLSYNIARDKWGS